MNSINIRRYLIILLFLSVMFTTEHFWSVLTGQHKEHELLLSTHRPVKEFEKISLEAKAAFVIDIRENKVLYAKNENQQLPLASITKIMTALVATELAPNSGMKIKIAKETLVPEGDNGFLVGESFHFRDMLDFMLVASSNDGARAVASVARHNSGFITSADANDIDSQTPREFFIEKMNEKTRELGMTQTFFMNESGLDESGEVAGAYGSAKDIAKLVTHVLKTQPHLLEATSDKYIDIRSSYTYHNATNTNKGLSEYPEMVISKTGYTELAGGNLAIVFEAGPVRPVAIVVLGSSMDGRFTDVETLLSASLKSIQN